MEDMVNHGTGGMRVEYLIPMWAARHDDALPLWTARAASIGQK